MGDTTDYRVAQIRDLGSLDDGGRIKLMTDTGQTHWNRMSADKMRRIAAIVAEPEG
jgi:hypothetical protein